MSLWQTFFTVESFETPRSESRPQGEVQTMEQHSAEWLRNHQVLACPICEKISTETFVKCPKCFNSVKPITAYQRLFVERLAFIATLMLIIFGFSFLSSAPDAMALPLSVPALYVLANQFAGVRFLEVFRENEVPEQAFHAFSWRRFVQEGAVLGTITIAIAVGFAIAALLGVWR